MRRVKYGLLKNVILTVVTFIVFILIIPTCEQFEPESVIIIHTDSVTDFSYDHFLAVGMISNVGKTGIDQHGFCWSESINPSVDSKTKIQLGARDSSGIFNYTVTGLSANTEYYIRAFASDENGTKYGEEISIRTSEAPAIPTITTTYALEITDSSALSGGNITDDGGSPIIARGVCWSTNSNPSTSDNHTTDGSGRGFFTSVLSDLECETIYYVRAYATNSVGTAYGNNDSFNTDTCSGNVPTVITTEITEITEFSALVEGNATHDGGSEITSRGICWSTLQLPTTSDNYSSDGTGTGNFIGSLTELECQTTYYVRAYAINSNGTGYGDQLEFTTSSCPAGLPVVITNSITDISETTALGGGEVTDNGGSSVTERGMCWSTSQNPTLLDNKTSDGTGTGSFTSYLSNLVCGTIYYARAFATNETGTSYGHLVSFTTTACQITLPTVLTSGINNITEFSAQGGGDVTGDGGGVVTARGVCWSKAQNPTVSDNHTTDGSGTGPFTSSMTGLECNSVYYVRAYAINPAGTSYGSQVSFTTSECPVGLPNVTTSSITEITDSGAQGGGYVAYDGGETVTARGVCWSTSPDPTIINNHTTDGVGIGPFISAIEGLECNTTYYVRAYATIESGTAYGFTESFTTLECQITPPTVTTSSITFITETGAVGGGFVTDDGGAMVTARGVCWGTSQNPTVSGNHTSDGTGLGPFISTIDGLECNTTYYVRAYATNSEGTEYGSEVSFTTLECPVILPTVITATIEDITETTAQGGGDVTDDGGGAVTAKGICWSTSPDPNLMDNHTMDGTGTGPFISSLKDLECNTTYYVKAYATNSAGTAFGSELRFTTLECPVFPPTVNTAAIGDITETTAQGGGDVTDDGGGEVTARGVCWSTSQDPTLADKHTVDGSGTGPFKSSIEGLTCNTTYYVRAYATNSAGTEYGAEESFTTLVCPAVLPTVTTSDIKYFSKETAWGGGTVTDDGGAEVTVRGVCWSTTPGPTISDNITKDGTGTGDFTSFISGLKKNTKYYVRAYATNIVGTAYGEQKDFKTRR